MTRVLGIVAPAGAPQLASDIPDAARDAAADDRHRRLGMFGTLRDGSGDVSGPVAAEGVTVVMPTTDEGDYIRERYFGELVRGVFWRHTESAR